MLQNLLTLLPNSSLGTSRRRDLGVGVYVQCPINRYGMVNIDLYSAIVTKVHKALNTLVSGEKPGSGPV